MTVNQPLSYAIANERRGWEYYNHVAITAADAQARALARDFASEEAEHVLTLERWLNALTGQKA
jgi:rubrerythrin